jgi:hypothetical protein
MADIHRERLLRAIRCLQLIQRTNSPSSSLAKAVGKALVPLLKEYGDYVISPADEPKAPPKGDGQPPAPPPAAEVAPGDTPELPYPRGDEG